MLGSQGPWPQHLLVALASFILLEGYPSVNDKTFDQL